MSTLLGRQRVHCADRRERHALCCVINGLRRGNLYEFALILSLQTCQGSHLLVVLCGEFFELTWLLILHYLNDGTVFSLLTLVQRFVYTCLGH